MNQFVSEFRASAGGTFGPRTTRGRCIMVRTARGTPFSTKALHKSTLSTIFSSVSIPMAIKGLRPRHKKEVLRCAPGSSASRQRRPGGEGEEVHSKLFLTKPAAACRTRIPIAGALESAIDLNQPEAAFLLVPRLCLGAHALAALPRFDAPLRDRTSPLAPSSGIDGGRQPDHRVRHHGFPRDCR